MFESLVEEYYCVEDSIRVEDSTNTNLQSQDIL